MSLILKARCYTIALFFMAIRARNMVVTVTQSGAFGVLTFPTMNFPDR